MISDVGTARYAYGCDDPAKPRRSESSVQHPNPIREVALNEERGDREHDAKVDGVVVEMRELLWIAIPLNKPVVDIAPGEHSLRGLQKEDKIGYPKVSLVMRTLQHRAPT